ncbi:acetyl-CoA synthetase-like protein [Aspergillus pseudoustus]|uniref:Acetyl-CoA synthetase-like protein n=1 Tax=Aspergillus pseudoustus TaxID=1810923 RepID=A0ABR4L4V3_9EURO
MPYEGPTMRQPETEGISIWSCLFENRDHGEEAGFCDAETGRATPLSMLKRYSEVMSTELSRTFSVLPGNVICIFCANSVWYPVAVFAALRLGAIISPTSAECTTQEAGHIIRTVCPKIVIVDRVSFKAVDKFLQRREAQSTTLITLTEAEGSSLGLQSVQAFSTQITRLQPVDPWTIGINRSSHEYCAVLCFTSGTTSQPKASMISHRNIISQLYQVKAYTRDDHPRVVLGVLPFYHITGIVHLLHLPILLNQKVVVMSRFSMTMLLKTIATFKCEELWLVPPILIRLVSNDTENRHYLQTVRQINTGAAPLGLEIIGKLAARFPDIAIRQAWGMTESCSCLTLTPPDDQTYANTHTVGKVVAGTLLRVVTPGTDQDVKAGESGEILAKGPQVMMRYFNDPKTTRETMTSDGFLRTGDIGFVDEHDFVHIKDRLKEIIKVKGVGVAPAELEDILMGHPDIKDAAVVGMVDPYSGQVPKAYVVLKPDAECSAGTAISIQNYVRKRCSRSKWLRGGIAFVTDIPKSASGKILRRRLPGTGIILDVKGVPDPTSRL